MAMQTNQEITLYHSRDARSFRCLWALEELSIQYNLVNMAFPPRFTTPEYLEINSLGTVPCLKVGEHILTESGAILQYLASQYVPAMDIPVDSPSYPDYLNWLHRSDATFTFPLAVVLRYSRFEADERKLQQAADDYTQFFLSRIKSVERCLSDGRPFLLGEQFSMADVAVHYPLYLAELMGLAYKFGVHTQNYLQRLKQRDAFKRATHAQANEPVLL